MAVLVRSRPSLLPPRKGPRAHRRDGSPGFLNFARGVVAKRAFFLPGSASFDVAATLDDVAAASAFTTAAPADRTFAATAAVEDATAGSTFTTTAPANQTFAASATLDDATAASGFTTAVAPARTFAAAATLDDVVAASAWTRAALPVVVGPVTGASTWSNMPDSQTFAVAATLGAVTASSAFRAAAAVVVGSVTAAAAFTASGPSVVTFAASGALGDVSPASAFTTSAPAGRTFAAAVTLGEITAAGAFTTAAPGGRIFTAAATAGNTTAAARFVTPTFDLPDDLLSALIAYLKTEPTVAAPLTENGVVKVFDELAAAGTDAPFLVIQSYEENVQGMSLEDEPVELMVQIVTSGLDQARALGKLVKAALDTPNFNPASLDREPFTFDGGEEYTCKRNRSRPHRRRGVGHLNRYIYVEDVEYEFRVTYTS